MNESVNGTTQMKILFAVPSFVFPMSSTELGSNSTSVSLGTHGWSWQSMNFHILFNSDAHLFKLFLLLILNFK